jgi:hypothetical protein
MERVEVQASLRTRGGACFSHGGLLQQNLPEADVQRLLLNEPARVEVRAIGYAAPIHDQCAELLITGVNFPGKLVAFACFGCRISPGGSEPPVSPVTRVTSVTA